MERWNTEGRLAVAVSGDYDEFLDRHAELVANVLAAMHRPTQTLVKLAVQHLLQDLSVGVAASISSMVAQSVSHCRNVARSTTNGRRRYPATHRVVNLLQPGLEKLARGLRRRILVFGRLDGGPCT